MVDLKIYTERKAIASDGKLFQAFVTHNEKSVYENRYDKMDSEFRKCDHCLDEQSRNIRIRWTDE